MPDDFKIKQTILHHLSASDIVHNQVSFAITRFSVNHNTNMGYSPAQIPAYNISGLIVVRVICNWLNAAMAC